jgi:hypothetical protein
MSEQAPDPYWQHDFAVELSPLGEQLGFGVRFKAHESLEPFHLDRAGDLVPLRVTRGTRRYFHGKPYQLEPDYRLTVGLHPLPPPTGEIGVVEEARWEGLRQREIGQAQGWYYPEDATLILWECFRATRSAQTDANRGTAGGQAAWRAGAGSSQKPTPSGKPRDTLTETRVSGR